MTTNSSSNNKDSVLAIVLLLLIIYALTKAKYYIGITIVYIVLALLFEKVAAITDLIWRKLTNILGIISSTIILSLLFYLIFFPIGVITRLFKKTGFIKFTPGLNSTFEERNKVFSKADLEQPF